MTTIYLHGMLGRKFRKEWKLEVSSVAEALRAIDINLGGKLKEYWSTSGREKKYCFRIGNYVVQDEIELKGTFGKASEIHIVPVVKGAKSAFGKILVGLAILSLFLIAPIAGALVTKAGALTAWGTIAVTLGAGLILGGITQMLTPIPKIGTDAEQDSSTVFEGASLAMNQGGPIPIAYGHVFASPNTISVSLVNENVSTTNTTTIGSVGSTLLDGGGTQFFDDGSTWYGGVNTDDNSQQD